MDEKYKAGFSKSLKISTICKLDEFAKQLNSTKAEVARKIIEQFVEHNDIEDLQN